MRHFATKCSAVKSAGPSVEPLLSKSRDLSHTLVGPCDQNVPGMNAEASLPAVPTGKRLRRRPRTRLSDYISDVACSRLGVKPAELSEIAVDREVLYFESS